MAEENSNSALGSVFAVIGFFAGMSVGGSSDMEGGEIFILVVILTFVGYAIGKWVEETIIKILFIIGAIITFIVNATIRAFIGEMLTAMFS